MFSIQNRFWCFFFSLECVNLITLFPAGLAHPVSKTRSNDIPPFFVVFFFLLTTILPLVVLLLYCCNVFLNKYKNIIIDKILSFYNTIFSKVLFANLLKEKHATSNHYAYNVCQEIWVLPKMKYSIMNLWSCRRYVP